MTSIQIIVHEKLNAIQCFCGFVARNHQCEKTIQGKIIFCTCSDECSKCCEQIKRDEYNEERWATDRDGYLICGTCYNKLSGEICTVFVKSVMYLLMNTATVILNNFF